MCGKCSDIILRKIHTPKEYSACLEYIKELLNNGDYILTEKSCDIDKIKDENGCWVSDTIYHVIKCRKCGQKFKCWADTYHGGGALVQCDEYSQKPKKKKWRKITDIVLFGVNIFDYEWQECRGELADVKKSFFGKRYILPVYKVVIDEIEYKFAALECSYYKWIFFIEEQ